jgi:hypothetical protein
VAPLAPSRRPSPHSRSRGWKEGDAGGNEEINELGFPRGEPVRGFLFRRDPRAAVDRDRTVEVDPRATGPLFAHAGRLFPGPGLGCFDPQPRELARARARASRPSANGPQRSTEARLRCCARPLQQATARVGLGHCEGNGPAGLVAKERTVHPFFQFPEVFFNRI